MMIRTLLAAAAICAVAGPALAIEPHWYNETSNHECKTSGFYAENIAKTPAAADPDLLIDWLRDKDMKNVKKYPSFHGSVIVSWTDQNNVATAKTYYPEWEICEEVTLIDWAAKWAKSPCRWKPVDDEPGVVTLSCGTWEQRQPSPPARADAASFDRLLQDLQKNEPKPVKPNKPITGFTVCGPDHWVRDHWEPTCR